MALDENESGKHKFGAKSEFVRSLDRAIPAADVVALAERRGMKVTAGFVYNVRSSANAKTNRNGSKHDRQRAATAERAEALLRAAIAQIGLARAREILEDVEQTFAGR
jgi:hypothetical protein